MLNLNLLPPQEKAKLAYAMRTRAVMAVAGAVGGVFLIGLALFLPTAFLLGFQRSEILRAVDLERESQIQAGIGKELERLMAVMRLAEVVSRSEERRPDLFSLIEGVLRTAPPAIQLQTLRFNSESRELTVDGFSPRRTVLLEFLRGLEGHPRIAKVSSPVVNIIKEADIRFSLTAVIK